MLLGVANHFYKESEGDWVCLELDPKLITDEVSLSTSCTRPTSAVIAWSLSRGQISRLQVKFEAAAPVGDKVGIETAPRRLVVSLTTLATTRVQAAKDTGEKFPHLYGPIHAAAVTKQHGVVRGSGGEVSRIFSIPGVLLPCVSFPCHAFIYKSLLTALGLVRSSCRSRDWVGRAVQQRQRGNAPSLLCSSTILWAASRTTQASWPSWWLYWPTSGSSLASPWPENETQMS